MKFRHTPTHSRVTSYASPTSVGGWIIVAAGLVMIGFSGCGKDISVYKSVPQTRIMDGQVAEGDFEPRFQMITAIAQRQSGTWFFKVADSIETMQHLSPTWMAFLETVQFDENDQPIWKLPDGWSVGQGSEMRFATLNAKTEGGTSEISISSLPGRQDLLSNVNRWRGQLGLGPLNMLQLADNLSTYKNDHLEFKVFDTKGPSYSGGMGGPFAGGQAAAPSANPHAKMPKPEADSLPFVFTAPEGWKTGKTSSVVLARWTKQSDERPVEIAILNMNPSDESWQMNIQAWANQLKLEQKPDVSAMTRKIEIGGQPARRIRLDATESQSPGQSVVAVLFASGQDGWMVKYSGDSEVVDQFMQEFDRFLQSISIDNPSQDK